MESETLVTEILRIARDGVISSRDPLLLVTVIALTVLLPLLPSSASLYTADSVTIRVSDGIGCSVSLINSNNRSPTEFNVFASICTLRESPFFITTAVSTAALVPFNGDNLA